MDERSVAEFVSAERQHWLSAQDRTADEKAASTLGTFEFIDLTSAGQLLILRFRLRETGIHEYLLMVDLASWEGEAAGTATALFEYIRFNLVDDKTWLKSTARISDRVSVAQPARLFE